MSDLISKLSDLRSQYNCFDESEREAYDTLSEAIKVLSAQPEQQWIPVSDSPPESRVNVLFRDIDGDVMLGYHIPQTPKTHFVEKGSWDMVKNVVAWMPLPEPYKENNDEL